MLVMTPALNNPQSGDEKLTKILNDGKDVFRAIAAKWKRIDVDQVSW